VRAKATFSLREVDITSDDSLHRRYLERIPVVALGDEELFDFFVDEAALEDRLYRLPGGASATSPQGGTIRRCPIASRSV
jgi:hypothetical protein